MAKKSRKNQTSTPTPSSASESTLPTNAAINIMKYRLPPSHLPPSITPLPSSPLIDAMNSIHTQIMNKISQTTLNSDKFIAFVVSPEGKSFLGSISASTDAITALQQPHSTPFTSREIRTTDKFSQFLFTYLPTHKSSYNSVYLEIRPAPLTAGFGLFATCLIPPSTVLLNIHPKAMIFTQSAAYPDLSDTLKVHPQSALAFHLTLERLKYSNSTHCLYLDTLPSHTDFSDLLMNWSDESLQTSFLNNGTPGNKGMFERGLKSRLTLIGDYCYYYKLLTDRSEFLVGVEGGVRSFTLEVFKWAMGVVLTRQVREASEARCERSEV